MDEWDFPTVSKAEEKVAGTILPISFQIFSMCRVGWLSERAIETSFAWTAEKDKQTAACLVLSG